PVWIWVYYAALGLVIWARGNWRKLSTTVSKTQNVFARLPAKWVIPALAVVAVLVWLTAATMPDDRLRVAFLDVGQGDATLIQKGSQQVLVDGGPSPQAIASALSAKMPFWDRTIDLVVLTHPHNDHLAGMVEVLKRYRVKQVLYPASPGEFSDSELYNEWLRLIEEKGIEDVTAVAGQMIMWGDMVIDVLNPQAIPFSGTQSDIDNNGAVLRLKMGNISFLLTSDVMREAEFELIAQRASLASIVLKAGHHGADTSTTAEFLAVVNPRLAVISAGKGNPFGHPNEGVLNRLAGKLGQKNIYRTDEHGTIEFTTDGERLWVRMEK
ncbi:MAG: MBL fold metallo-hydrolase, partial [Chloroflexi bacterium]|nr:MBL fold metallo-hydrolase [Chloroflexota bacterium]